MFHPLRLLTVLLGSAIAVSASTPKHSDDEFDSNAIPPTSLPNSVTIHSWPLDSQQPFPFGVVKYNPSTRVGTFYPEEDADAGIVGPADGSLVRLGAIQGTSWFGTVVEKSTLKNTEKPAQITLYIDHDGYPFNLEYTLAADATPSTTNSKSSSSSSSPATVIIVTQPAGPVPHLNKPVVLDPDGKLPVPEVEKTFLQKYWWVLLGAAIILLGGGGGGSE
ncbi:hypothetical protein DFH27DRAFT_654566 [Peziza echinospora]|nr:hypothetical protein DFH27DRAFT_654566 [Peziza echinospora]